MNARARSACWLAAAAVCGAAVAAPPLDRLADRWFAWHMAQHLALLYVLPAALLLADPFGWWVRVAGKRAVARTAALAAPLRAATHPALAAIAFAGTLWLAHFSGLYELALQNAAVHAGEHLLFLAAGLFFWMPILAPAPLRPLSFPARLLYCLVLLPQCALVAVAIDAAQRPMYAHYAAALGSAAALADQRDAAAVMWIGGGLAGFGAFLGTLAAWAKRETRMEPA